MRNFILAALAVLFSIYGVASAAQDGVFEIEAEHYKGLEISVGMVQ